MCYMQVTAFVALLALDAQRIGQRRCDAAPCIRLPASLMYGQEGHDGHAGQNRETGQNGQLNEPLVEGSSGEMPLSTPDMYRESSGAAPAGADTLLVCSLPLSMFVSLGARLRGTRKSDLCILPVQSSPGTRVSADYDLSVGYTRDVSLLVDSASWHILMHPCDS